MKNRENLSEKSHRIRSTQEFCETYYYHKYLYSRTGSQRWLDFMIEHVHPRSECVDGLLKMR